MTNQAQTIRATTVLWSAIALVLLVTAAPGAVVLIQHRRTAAIQDQTLTVLRGVAASLDVLERNSAQPSPLWTYRVEAPSDADFETQMNEAGRQGWEIVALRRVEEDNLEVLLNSGSRMKYEVVLKRRVR